MSVYVLYNEDANCIVGVYDTFDAAVSSLYMPMWNVDERRVTHVIDGNGIGYYVEEWDVTGE